MNKLELFNLIIKNDVEKHTYPDSSTLGIPNINTVKLELVIEIIPKDYFYSSNIEFFILSSFNTTEGEGGMFQEGNNLQIVLENEKKEKWVFSKILFMNENIEKIFDKNDMNKVNVIEIKHSDKLANLIPLFKRHLSFVLPDGYKYRIMTDEINFNTLFIDSELKQYEEK